MPFNLYLSSSINYEQTHQLILKTLLEDPQFLRELSGEDHNEYQIVLEPEGKLFDIGIKSKAEEKWIYLIELKMWSSLSDHQLKSQSSFLIKEGVRGLHVLLGTADLIYVQSETYDKIRSESNSLSQKVGYQDLITALDNFVAGKSDSPLTQMAVQYSNALKSQHQHILTAWQRNDPYVELTYYSLYYHLSKLLPAAEFKMYPVNNAAGGSTIFNDQHSWIGFGYQGHDFEAYQEILDGVYMVRIYSGSANSHLRNEVKQLFIKHFSVLDNSGLSWSDYSKASKWHKIITYKPDIKTENDIQELARLMVANRPLIHQVIRQIKQD